MKKIGFLKGIIMEWNNITFPKKKEFIQAFKAVITVCGLYVVLISTYDLIFSKLINMIFS